MITAASGMATGLSCSSRKILKPRHPCAGVAGARLHSSIDVALELLEVVVRKPPGLTPLAADTR